MNITIFHRVNDSHSDMDSTAEWAINNMSQLRTAEIDTRRWTKTACTGNCNQGDKCNCGPKEAASACSEYLADDGKPTRPGWTMPDWLTTGALAAVSLSVGLVAYVVLTAAMKIMGPQQ